MKKIISCILALCIMNAFTSCAFTEETVCKGYPKPERFAKVKIPFPDTLEDNSSWLTRARYKDTQEVIPLSMYYNDSVYATIPIENKDRELEAFVPEPL